MNGRKIHVPILDVALDRCPRQLISSHLFFSSCFRINFQSRSSGLHIFRFARRVPFPFLSHRNSTAELWIRANPGEFKNTVQRHRDDNNNSDSNNNNNKI